MYHYVRDLAHSRYPKIKGLEYDLFKQQIEFFEKNFHVVTMEQVIDAWNSPNAELPEKALLLTFDDGYIDHFAAVFPVLREHHMQGSFFIPGKTFCENQLLDVNKVHFILASAPIQALNEELFKRMDYYRGTEFDFPQNEELFSTYAVPNRFDTKETIFAKRILQTVLPERLRNIISTELFEKYVGLPEEMFARELYMNRDQLRCLKDSGMYIGLHGYDHYWLGNLDEVHMKRDIDQALDAMDEFINPRNWVLNYPYGSYNENVLRYIEKKGCTLGMTTEVALAEVNVHGRYVLPRFDCNDFPPKSDNFRTVCPSAF